MVPIRSNPLALDVENGVENQNANQITHAHQYWRMGYVPQSVNTMKYVYELTHTRTHARTIIRTRVHTPTNTCKHARTDSDTHTQTHTHTNTFSSTYFNIDTQTT